MPANEWEAGDENKGQEGDQGGQPPLTPEEHQAVATMLQSGMSVSEVVARARRDYATEKGAAGGAGGAGAAGAAGDAGGDEEVLTAGRARVMMATAKNEARLEVSAENARVRLDDSIEHLVAKHPNFTKVGAGRVEAIKGQVGRILQGNVRLGQMSRSEFNAAVAETTEGVLKQEVEEAAGISGTGSADEAAARLAAQAKTGEGNSLGGGTTKPSAASAAAKGPNLTPDGKLKWTPEQEHFGVGVVFPSDAEANAAHQAELAAAYNDLEAKT